MNTNELRQQLKDIAESEYDKIYTQYKPMYQNVNNYSCLKAYSVLNTPLLGIIYYISSISCSYAFYELEYSIGSYSFPTLQEAENYIKKSKSKDFKNPFEVGITKKYYPSYSVDNISDEILKQVKEPIKLKRTKIYEK